MNFDSPSEVEQLVWEMKLADWPRAVNRTRINDLANGVPPYSEDEERANNIAVNVNPLTHTKLCHDARRQYYSAFLKPGKFFHARCDHGPRHRRQEFTTTVTNLISRIMKRSPVYFEKMRSTFAQDVLHGIGPGTWEDRDHWCPDSVGVEDVLIPANTLLTMKNLPFFAVYRSYTGMQLKKMISGPKVHKGWNLELCKYLIKWVDQQGSALLGSTWPEVWSPEKMADRIKGDGGLYASDAIPTIDCYDFYFWNDESKQSGWNRRVVLDAYGSPGAGGMELVKGNNKFGDESKNKFLFDPGKAKYASKLSELISFQFADLSAVAPFRYHSIRSLGFLVWAVCQLQNRLYCKIQEATFESLMQYFRVKSADDVERALKVELINRGFIDESIHMIPQAERWQTNMPLTEFAYGRNDSIIESNSSSYIQQQDYSEGGKERKTKFQVMAEVNATTALVSSGLLQAYQYQTFEDIEIFRRFMRKNSADPDVREFRVAALKAGVPEEVLYPECWEISTEQVMGAGNKTMEMTIAQQLLQMRPMYDPPAQRKILHDVTLAITDNAAMTEELVPVEEKEITSTVHDAQIGFASLMMGLPVDSLPTQNPIEVIETWLGELALVIHGIEQQGGMTTPEKLKGLQNVIGQIDKRVKAMAADKQQEERVKKYETELGQLTNLVKGYAQRLQQAQKAAAQQGQAGGIDPKDAAKIKGIEINAQVKAKNATQSHGMRTAQKQIQWEADQKRKQEEHQMDMQRQQDEHRLEMQRKQAELQTDIVTEHVKTAAEIKRENARMRATEDSD